MANNGQIQLELTTLDGIFTIIKIEPDAGVPNLVEQSSFFSITRTLDELSIICEDDLVPSFLNREGKWRILKLEGLFEFDEIGILNSITMPLAASRISLLAVSTFNTDYILIQEKRYQEAVKILQQSGHQVT